MRLRLLSLTLALSMLLFSVFAFAPARPAAAASTASFPITTTLLDSAGNTVGTLTGTVSNLAVAPNGTGGLNVTGLLNGVATFTAGPLAGQTANIVNQTFSTLLTASGACTILHLTLGPIDLNLLGLMVHTNQIVLDITAQAGSGNLLGNLLCAVAHLLDSNGAPLTLSNLLNRILGLL